MSSAQLLQSDGDGKTARRDDKDNPRRGPPPRSANVELPDHHGLDHFPKTNRFFEFHVNLQGTAGEYIIVETKDLIVILQYTSRQA